MTNNPMANKAMRNGAMTKDRELDFWREQWSSVAPLSSELKHQVQEKIKRQHRRFWLGNLAAMAALAGTLILALYQFRHPANGLEKGAATGAFVLLFVSAAFRLWILRGTWRAETQSIRAFAELWQRRVRSQIRGLKVGMYIAISWLIFCACLAAANWRLIRLDIVAHPIGCLALTAIIAVMLPVIWLGAMWFRRHKAAELNELTRLLEEMQTVND
jgi:uncharacterized membrane protein